MSEKNTGVEDGNIPGKPKIPSMKHLDDNTHQLFNLYFRGAGPTNAEAKALWRYYARRINALLREYNQACDQAEAYSRDNLFAIHACSEHLEACIHHTVRAIELAEYIRCHQESPSLPTALDALDYQKNQSLKQLNQKILDVENSFARAQIKDGESFILKPNENEMTLGDCKLEYKQLAHFIEELHSVAMHLEDYRDPALTVTE